MPASEYCTAAQVAEEFKDITFGSGTSIGTTRVERFIEEASAHIDGKIGLLYTTPIDETDNPKAFLVVKQICLALVARRLRSIMNVRAPGATETQATKGENSIDPEAMLDQIVEGTMVLLDADKRRSGDGVQSYASSNALEKTFQKGVKQW